VEVNENSQILREARNMLGLSQMDVALKAGVNLGQYQRLEYGTRDLDTCTMRVGLSICYAFKAGSIFPYIKKNRIARVMLRDDPDIALYFAITSRWMLLYTEKYGYMSLTVTL